MNAARGAEDTCTSPCCERNYDEELNRYSNRIGIQGLGFRPEDLLRIGRNVDCRGATRLSSVSRGVVIGNTIRLLSRQPSLFSCVVSLHGGSLRRIVTKWPVH